MNSHPSVDQIRWSRLRSHLRGPALTLSNTIPYEFGHGLQETIRKRKRPVNARNLDNEERKEKEGGKRKEPASYEVLWCAKPPLMCLISVQHSRQKERLSLGDTEEFGAVLKPLNEYEIYAPMTLQERQQKLII